MRSSGSEGGCCSARGGWLGAKAGRGGTRGNENVRQQQTRHCSGGTVSKRRRGRLENKRAACEWERGRSGQGKYDEEACRSGGVSAWGEARVDAGGHKAL